MKGTESCFGSLSKPVEPTVSAPVAKSLFAAGGCLIGKTNMTEFGAKASSDSPLSGITSNPRNLYYTTGGSSAGAAASVAAGEMSATVAQFSYNMGYMGVENALKLANGESIPDNIDTGTVLVTADNAADFM